MLPEEVLGDIVGAFDHRDDGAGGITKGRVTEQARAEGKPDNIIEKMVEGRMRNFYALSVLTEQAFVKDDKQTVGKFAESNGMKLVKFVSWRLGQE